MQHLLASKQSIHTCFRERFYSPVITLINSVVIEVSNQNRTSLIFLG